MTYNIEDIDHLDDRIENEGWEYFLTTYANWDKFDGTPLGDAIAAYRAANERLVQAFCDACREVELYK